MVQRIIVGAAEHSSGNFFGAQWFHRYFRFRVPQHYIFHANGDQWMIPWFKDSIPLEWNRLGSTEYLHFVKSRTEPLPLHIGDTVVGRRGKFLAEQTASNKGTISL